MIRDESVIRLRGGSASATEITIDDSTDGDDRTRIDAGPADQPASADRNIRFRPHLLLYALAFFPLVVMLIRVLTSARMQWFDYWDLLPGFVNPDGSLAIRHLLDQHQGHILGLPRIVYWANIHLFGGSNRSLGVFVCAIGAAQVVLLSVELPRRLSPLWRVGLTVVISTMIFASQGLHNYARAMSGTAWITANLLVIGAIVAGAHGRAITATALVVLASFTYGTGLVGWVILPLVLVATRRASVKKLASVITVGLIVVVFYALHYEGAQGQTRPALDPADVLRRTFQVLGSLLSQDADLSVIFGAAGVGALLSLAWLARVERSDRVVVFVAVGFYGLGSALLIGGARGGVFDDNIGLASRYASLSAMIWLAVVVLAATLVPRLVTTATIGVISSISVVGGARALAEYRAINVLQDEYAIAMRLDVDENWVYGGSRHIPSGFLESLGHYPFNDSFDGDCGWFGRTVADDQVRDVDHRDAGALDAFAAQYNAQSLRLKGWFDTTAGDVRCILFADDRDVVVGAASYGVLRPDVTRDQAGVTGASDIGFQGVVPTTDGRFRAYAVVAGDDLLHPIPGELTTEELTPS